jgi:hypothetical protein
VSKSAARPRPTADALRTIGELLRPRSDCAYLFVQVLLDYI